MKRLGILGVWGWCAFSFAAIIGTDDRLEWYQIRDSRLREVARSAAVLVRASKRKIDEHGRWTKSVKTFQEQDKLCSDVRFSEQLSPGRCSAFLVGERLVATARHCVPNQAECDNTQVVFDFHVTGPGAYAPLKIFRCREIVASGDSMQWDWTLLRLDAAVKDRVPMKVSKTSKPSRSEVVALGFPSGLPLKASHATTDSLDGIEPHDEYFEAGFDAFGGSSGSAVINARTYEVEGLLNVVFGELTSSSESGTRCQRLRVFADPKAASFPWNTRSWPLAKALDALR